MRVIAFVIVVLGATRVWAVDTLLLELTWRQPGPVTLPALYSFGASDERRSASWVETVDAFNYNSWADQSTVSNLNLPLTQTFAFDQYYPFVVMTNDGQSPEESGTFGCATCWFSRLVAHQSDPFGTGEEWAARVAEAGWEIDLHVPLIGHHGLVGYTLTDIERLVTTNGQTVRLYGVVPEPATCVLALLCLLHVSTSFRRSK